MAILFNPLSGQFDIVGSGGGSSSNAFGIVQTPAGTSPTADSASDTLTLTSSDSTVTITGDATTDTIDIKLANTYQASLPLTTKGDILAYTGSAYSRLAVGTNTQVLTADSTATNGFKWADVPTELPSQTGNSGKYLTTNGTVASWGTVSASDATKLPLAGGTMTGSINMGANTITSSGNIRLDATANRYVGLDPNNNVGFDCTTGSVSLVVGGSSIAYATGSAFTANTINPTGGSGSIGSGLAYERIYYRQLIPTGYTNSQMHGMTPAEGTLIHETTNKILCVYLNGSWQQLSMSAAP
jgi:hypothetical protein